MSNWSRKTSWSVSVPDCGIKTGSIVRFGGKWWQVWKRKAVYVETEPGSGKFKKWVAPKPQSKSNNKDT